MKEDQTARRFRPAGSSGSSYDYNVQWSPDKCGLELLDEIETGGSYEFCTTLLFRDTATDQLYVAQDSGCSCPTPFEDFTSLSDFVQPQSEEELVRLIDSHHRSNPSPSDVMKFVRTWKNG